MIGERIGSLANCSVSRCGALFCFYIALYYFLLSLRCGALLCFFVALRSLDIIPGWDGRLSVAANIDEGLLIHF